MTKPWSTSFWRMAGSCVVPTAAALSLSMMSHGVPLGATDPPQRELEPGEPHFLRRRDLRRAGHGPEEAHLAKVLPKPLPPAGPIALNPHPRGVMIDASIADDQRQKSLNRCGDSLV